MDIQSPVHSPSTKMEETEGFQTRNNTGKVKLWEGYMGVKKIKAKCSALEAGHSAAAQCQKTCTLRQTLCFG